MITIPLSTEDLTKVRLALSPLWETVNSFGVLLYRRLAVSPHWPSIREHMEGDTFRRGQALALGGVEALLSDLHPRAVYAEGVLTLDKPYEAVVETAGRGITLVPCVFAWPRVDVLVQPGYRPTLAYPPRGAANLWSSASPPTMARRWETAELRS